MSPSMISSLTSADFPTPPDPSTTSLYSRMVGNFTGEHKGLMKEMRQRIFIFSRRNQSLRYTASTPPTIIIPDRNREQIVCDVVHKFLLAAPESAQQMEHMFGQYVGTINTVRHNICKISQ